MKIVQFIGQIPPPPHPPPPKKKCICHGAHTQYAFEVVVSISLSMHLVTHVPAHFQIMQLFSEQFGFFLVSQTRQPQNI